MALRRKGALSLEQTNTLIESVKSFPCIWDQDNEHYIHRSTIANSWAEIAKQIQLPEDLIRAKWKNLRDLFMRESKRTKVTSADEYGGKWKYFKKLWFLYRSDTSELVSEDEGSEVADFPEPTHEQYVVKIEPPDGNDFLYLDAEREANEISPGLRTGSNKNSRSDRDDVSDQFLEGPKRRRANRAYTDKDCDMMFLMSLTPYFKLLKPIRKLVVRNKMQEMILKEIQRTAVNGHL